MSELYAKADVERAVRGLHPHIAANVLASLTPVRLPVIETCGECAHNVRNGSGNAMCVHPSLQEGTPVRLDNTPPLACPLRRPR